MTGFDRWGANDAYPDDPDFECNECGCCFNAPLGHSRKDFDIECPECNGTDIHGGGYYG